MRGPGESSAADDLGEFGRTSVGVRRFSDKKFSVLIDTYSHVRLIGWQGPGRGAAPRAAGGVLNASWSGSGGEREAAPASGALCRSCEARILVLLQEPAPHALQMCG